MANRRNNVIFNSVQEESVSEPEKLLGISRAGSNEHKFLA